jgi:hypothetical protein
VVVVSVSRRINNKECLAELIKPNFLLHRCPEFYKIMCC